MKREEKWSFSMLLVWNCFRNFFSFLSLLQCLLAHIVSCFIHLLSYSFLSRSLLGMSAVVKTVFPQLPELA